MWSDCGGARAERRRRQRGRNRDDVAPELFATPAALCERAPAAGAAQLYRARGRPILEAPRRRGTAMEHLAVEYQAWRAVRAQRLVGLIWLDTIGEVARGDLSRRAPRRRGCRLPREVMVSAQPQLVAVAACTEAMRDDVGVQHLGIRPARHKGKAKLSDPRPSSVAAIWPEQPPQVFRRTRRKSIHAAATVRIQRRSN